MTLYHLVLFKLKPQPNMAAFQVVHNGFNTMKEHIPVVLKSTFGENITQRGKGYTHALVVELKGKEDLETYIKHPHHVELATKFKECVLPEETLAVDYEA